MTEPAPTLRVLPCTGLGEVPAGADLASLLAGAVQLQDGDVLVVTSKVVSKAEGRVVTASREAVLDRESDRVVATRGRTAIVRTHHGLVMAAAGVDASNTVPGTVVLLPQDPDASARRLRERVADLTGSNVAVVVTDTAGRAWRTGQTDIAVGAAGLEVLLDHAGRPDSHGTPLVVTAPAVADEVAAAGDLVKGKLRGCPAAVVRGLQTLVLPRGVHGAGARALVRPEAEDMFGYGAREAVLRAVRGDPESLRGFGRACAPEELAEELAGLAPAPSGHARFHVSAAPAGDGEARVEAHLVAADARALGALETRALAVAFALGWVGATGEPAPVECGRSQDGGQGDTSVSLRFRPGTP